MNIAVLDTFGDWERMLAGQMKGKTAEQVAQDLNSFNCQQKEILQKIIPQIVDSTIHHLLHKVIQQNNLQIIVSKAPDSAYDLKAFSDGLAVELYGIQGWIARFSSKTKGTAC